MRGVFPDGPELLKQLFAIVLFEAGQSFQVICNIDVELFDSVCFEVVADCVKCNCI